MTYTQILSEVVDGICTITLNRPEKLNAFTGTMGDELYGAFRAASSSENVKAIVLTGAGKAFCAGVDMKALADPAEAERIVATPFLSQFPLENYGRTKPTICAVNGSAIGVGITMSLSFDIRIAAEDAKLSIPFAKLGLLPGLGSTYLLPRLVGRGKALEMLLSASAVTAAEAHQFGLVERVVPSGQVLDAAKDLANILASYDPQILANIKEAVNFSDSCTLEQAIRNEGQLLGRLHAARSASSCK